MTNRDNVYYNKALTVHKLQQTAVLRGFSLIKYRSNRLMYFWATCFGFYLFSIRAMMATSQGSPNRCNPKSGHNYRNGFCNVACKWEIHNVRNSVKDKEAFRAEVTMDHRAFCGVVVVFS